MGEKKKGKKEKNQKGKFWVPDMNRKSKATVVIYKSAALSGQ